MRVLVIWQEIPESTRLYIFDNPNADEMSDLERCNGNLVNATMDDEINDALERLQDKIDKRKPDWDLGQGPLQGPIDRVIVTGIVF